MIKMTFKHILTLLSFLLILTSCGGSKSETFNAPVIQRDAGVIASCTTKAQAQELAESYGGKFRVIHEKSRLMEIIGIDNETIKKNLPKAKLRANKVFPNVVAMESLSEDEIQSQSSSLFFHLGQINADRVGNDALGAGIKVAVVDSGVYLQHEHLKTQILSGRDFYNGDNDPNDDNGHGTHVAGLVAGLHSGVAPQAQIIPVKVLSANGSGDIGTVAAGVLYAIDQGADIINLSLGGSTGGIITSEVQALINAVGTAQSRGVMIVAAAGNGGADGVGDCNDKDPIYPASIESVAVVSVAAVDSQNSLTQYSNFGAITVDIAAPGGSNYMSIYSTYRKICSSFCSTYSNYVGMSGTSMASPIVAGVVAMIMSVRSDLSLSDIRQILFQSGTVSASLNGKVGTGKVVNAEAAVALARSW
jgi:subtilisin family serine protease